LGNGKGAFKGIPSSESGFYVPGDAKALVRLSGVKGGLYLATQNRDTLKVFSPATESDSYEIRPEAMDQWATVVYPDGRKERLEFYYGSGYQSQSTRRLRIPRDARKIIVEDSRNRTRNITPQ
jgi:hypothetical protein